MSESTITCPECASEYTYEMGDLTVCSLCAHEWVAGAAPENDEDAPAAETVVRDVVGNVLANGDAVTIAKTMKVKGAQSALKVGTKVRSIRLIDDVGDGHNIEAKIDGFGPMLLRGGVVKKIV